MKNPETEFQVPTEPNKGLIGLDCHPTEVFGLQDAIAAKAQLVSSLVAFHDAVLIYNAQLNCTSCGYNSCNELPSQLKDIVGKPVHEIVPGIDPALFTEAQHNRTGRKFEWEQQLAAGDGSKWIKHSFNRIAFPGSNNALLVHCIDDITKEKSRAIANDMQLLELKGSLKEFSEIVENATEIIFKVDKDGLFTFISAEFTRALGYNIEQMLGKHFSVIVHPDDLSEIADVFNYISQHGKTTNNRIFRVNNTAGHYKWISCSALFLFDEDGNPSHCIGFAQDVTDLQEAVNTLRAAETRYAAFIQHSTEAIWRFEADKALPVTMEPDAMIEYLYQHAYLAECNDKMANYYNCEAADQLTGWPLTRLFDTNKPAHTKILRDFIDNGFKLTNFETVETDAGGRKAYFTNNLVGIVKDGFLLRVWGTHRNITPQRLAEQQVRDFAQAMQNISDAIISTDLDFKILAWNKAAEEIYGIKAEEVLGKPIRQFVNHVYIHTTRAEALAALDKDDYFEGQVYFDRSDGKRIYLIISISFVRNDAGERIGFAGIHKDITEQREADEALRISEERYRSLVDALREGIILVDKKGAIVACNTSVEQIFGITRETIFQYPQISGFEYYHEDGTEFPLNEHPGCVTLSTGQSLQQVVMGVKRPNGSFRWISVNTEPIYYSDKRQSPDAVVASIVDITEAKAANLKLEIREKQLREYIGHVSNILDSITDGFIAIDKDSNVLLWNKVIGSFTGISMEHALGKSIYSIFPMLQNTPLQIKLDEVLKTSEPFVSEHYSEEYTLWFETSAYPSSHGLFIYFRDITQRKRQEKLLSLEKEVLEINTYPGATLTTTVSYFLERLEKIFPGMMCSVMELQEDGRSLRCLAAPSLPAGFKTAVNGALIGPKAGSCGTAIYNKKVVISTDILSDPLWEDYVPLAREYNLRSCWSFPILNSSSEVTATIAAYHSYVKMPSEQEYSILERNSQLLGIIIENKRAEAKIRISNERYLLATKATKDALWDLDLQSNFLFWGEGFASITGYHTSELDNPLELWRTCIHPDDLDQVNEGLASHIERGCTNVWEMEYRFRIASGEYRIINDRGFLVYNNEGKPTRMVGSFQDVTEKREMQKKLLKQELDKQKLIAKAVIEAQEKERAEIGKELHDNVNQILSTARLYLEVAKNDEKERLNLIKRSADNIFSAVSEIRCISRSLVPSSIADLGLIESIEDLVENIQLTRKLHIEFYHSGYIKKCSNQQQKLMLFRIIQEQVNNVLKHAEASNLIIELSSDDIGISLSISDDGKGFDPNNNNNKKGVGLSNIRSRAELFNGTMNMVTAPGKGCTLLINVPY